MHTAHGFSCNNLSFVIWVAKCIHREMTEPSRSRVVRLGAVVVAPSTQETEFDVNAVASPQHLSPVASDEIDLIQLIGALWKQKALIIAVTALSGAVGLLYALVATPYYNVQSILRPAAIKDLDELNHLGIYELSPK